MSSRIKNTPASMTINLGAFRFMQNFTNSEIRVMRKRNAIAKFLVDGMVEEAFQNGYELLDVNGEVIEFPSDKEFKRRFAKMNHAIKQMLGDQRAYGWSQGAIVRVRKEDELRWFTDSSTGDNADVQYVFGDNFEVREAHFTLKGSGKVSQFAYRGRGLENTFLMIDEKAELYTTESGLEDIWDNIFVIMIIDSQSGTYARRVGGGIHRLLVDMSFFSDEEDMVQLRNQIFDLWDNMDDDTKMMMAGKIGDFETKHDLYTGGGQINFTEIHEIQLLKISMSTGVPREKMEGKNIAKGASEVNQKNYITQLEKIQKASESLILWANSQLLGIDADRVRFKVFRELSETEALEVKTLQIEALEKALPLANSFNIDLETIVKWIGIDDLDVSNIEAPEPIEMEEEEKKDETEEGKQEDEKEEQE